MIPLLAQSLPQAQAVRDWLEVFFWFVGSGAATGGLLYYIKALRAPPVAPTAIQPQPLIVQEAEKFALLSACEARHGRLEQEFGRERIARKGIYDRIEEMDGRAAARTETLRKEVKDDIRSVHDRINDVLRAVSRLEGTHE